MNKNLYILVAIFCFTAISQKGIAQRKSDDNNYIHGTEYGHKGSKKDKEVIERPEANVVKFGLLYWISGNIPFYYERRVTPWLGLQFGLGMTTRDFMGDLATITIDAFRSNEVQAYNNYGFYGTQGRRSSIGIYASFQPKFYPRQGALTGFFVSPMVEFKRFNYKAEYTDPNGIPNDYNQPVYTSQTMNEYRNAVDFTINLGRQWLLPSKVSLELMGGVGFRKIWEQRRYIIQETNVYNPVTGNIGDAYVTTIQPSTFFRPEFNLSFLIGGCF